MGFSHFHELLAAHYNLSFLPELNEHRLLRNYLKLEACELSASATGGLDVGAALSAKGKLDQSIVEINMFTDLIKQNK